MEFLRTSMAMTSATAAHNNITTNTAALSKVNTMVLTKASTATSHVMADLSMIKDTDNRVATSLTSKTPINPTNKATLSLNSL